MPRFVRARIVSVSRLGGSKVSRFCPWAWVLRRCLSVGMGKVLSMIAHPLTSFFFSTVTIAILCAIVDHTYDKSHQSHPKPIVYVYVFINPYLAEVLPPTSRPF